MHYHNLTRGVCLMERSAILRCMQLPLPFIYVLGNEEVTEVFMSRLESVYGRYIRLDEYALFVLLTVRGGGGVVSQYVELGLQRTSTLDDSVSLMRSFSECHGRSDELILPSRVGAAFSHVRRDSGTHYSMLTFPLSTVLAFRRRWRHPILADCEAKECQRSAVFSDSHSPVTSLKIESPLSACKLARRRQS